VRISRENEEIGIDFVIDTMVRMN